MRDALEQFHIRSCVLDALGRHGIASDSPLRARLEANATIAGGTDSRVIMKNGNSLDAEIENFEQLAAGREFPDRFTHGRQEQHRRRAGPLRRHRGRQSPRRIAGRRGVGLDKNLRPL